MWSPVTDMQAYTGLIIGSWLNILLVAIPLGWAGQWQLSCMTCRFSEHPMIPLQPKLLPLAAHFAHFPAVATFVINIVALIPLALVLGEITEVGGAAPHQGLEMTFR